MKDNLYQANYDITKKSKLKIFYENNKSLIFLTITIFVILFASLSFNYASKEKKKILLAENYIQAKVYLENGNSTEATNVLKNLILLNDTTYSTLALFLLLNQNLITDNTEVSSLFDHLLQNNKFEKELKNLLIYKKVLFESNFINEQELLKSINPLLNENDLWKPHALLLLGDYFSSKNENLKAAEFYSQILLIKNLQIDFYNQAQTKLSFIKND